MKSYLIELTHRDEHEACVKALEAVERYGAHLLTNLEWGCADGYHAGLFLAELSSREEAMLLVPPGLRHEARVVRVNKYSKEEIAAMVQELSGPPVRN